MNYEECHFLRVLDDGSLLVQSQADEQVIKIHGIKMFQPIPRLYMNWMTERLPRVGGVLRYIAHSVDAANRIDAMVQCYGWQDKSGDVWLDLAIVLLDQGLVEVAAGEFAERNEYLEHEQVARLSSKGVWAGNLEL